MAERNSEVGRNPTEYLLLNTYLLTYYLLNTTTGSYTDSSLPLTVSSNTDVRHPPPMRDCCRDCGVIVCHRSYSLSLLDTIAACDFVQRLYENDAVLIKVGWGPRVCVGPPLVTLPE